MVKQKSYSSFLQASQERGYVFLRKSSFFKECSEAFLSKLMQDLKTELFSAGDVIMEEGAVAENLFCLEMGQVDILIGRDYVKVGSVGEGSVFGEMAMFQHLGPTFAKRSASVKAACFCVCRSINHTDFHQILKSFPKEKHFFEKVALARHKELQSQRKAADEHRITEKDQERSAVLWDIMRTRICNARSYERQVMASMQSSENEAWFEDPCYGGSPRGDAELKTSHSSSMGIDTTASVSEDQGGNLFPSRPAALSIDSELELLHGEAVQTQQSRPAMLLPKTVDHFSPRLATTPRSPMSRPHTIPQSVCSRQKSERNKASPVLALRQCKYGLPSLPEGISTRGPPPQPQISFKAVLPPDFPRHWCPSTEANFAPGRPVTAPTKAALQSARAQLQNLNVSKDSCRWVELEC